MNFKKQSYGRLVAEQPLAFDGTNQNYSKQSTQRKIIQADNRNNITANKQQHGKDNDSAKTHKRTAAKYANGENPNQITAKNKG